MASQDDVRRLALALPGVVEEDDRFIFSVIDRGVRKGFVWAWSERIKPNKPRVPRNDVVAVRVADLEQKDLLLGADSSKFFTEPHYDGYRAVLVRLPQIDADELEDLITEAWRTRAPRALLAELDDLPAD